MPVGRGLWCLKWNGHSDVEQPLSASQSLMDPLLDKLQMNPEKMRATSVQRVVLPEARYFIHEYHTCSVSPELLLRKFLSSQSVCSFVRITCSLEK